MVKGLSRLAKGQQPANAQQANQISQSDRHAREGASKVLKYLDDYRSANDTKALREEGYEIDYDRLVGVGTNSAVFLAHSVNAPPPPLDKNGQRPIYTPGYDVAAKVVAKKWISSKRPLKTRTGNLKLALALGQTKPDNNILKVIDVFKTPDRIFIFMQYCAYGNVISFMRRNGPVPSKLAQRWSGQMAAALCFLHRFHVAHRNYKLENVLIDETLNAKLTGFGLSKFCVDLQTKQPVLSRTICGSEPYLPPEMLKEAAQRNYDPKQADVWAFGVGVFLCVTRRYPFEAESLRALKAEQLARRFMERDTRKRLRQNVREMLSSIFTLDPNQRPTMEELYTSNSWLNPIGAAILATRSPQERTPEIDAAGQADAANPSPAAHPAEQQQQQQQHHQQANAGHDSHSHQRSGKSDGMNDKLTPVTPVAYTPTDALPLGVAEAEVENISRIN